jgi:hypothetical protein
MTESELILKDIVDGVEIDGTYSLDFSRLQRTRFYQAPTGRPEDKLKRWARKHNLQYDVDLTSETDQPVTITVHFLRCETKV